MIETLLIMMVILLMTGIILGITPYTVRRNIHFGVMLPDSASDMSILKKWRKQFLTCSVVLVLLAVIPLFFVFFMNLEEQLLIEYLSISGGISLMVLLVLQASMYFYFHKQVKDLKAKKFPTSITNSEARLMVSTSFHQQKLTLSNWWFVGLGGLVIMVTALLPIFIYDQIPDIIPVNWGIDGAVNFREKSPIIFMLMPLIQTGQLVIFVFINHALRKTKQVIRPQDKKTSVGANIKFRRAMSLCMLILSITTLMMLSIAQFMMAFAVNDTNFMGGIGVGFILMVFIGIIFLVFKYGQGGERIIPANEMVAHLEMVDDDDYWTWGMFYYNANDPAIFVEKKFGIGSTVNFARWQAWVMLLGVLIFVAGTVVIAYMMVD